MSKTSKTIAKNASMLMLSQLTTWGLSLLLTVFLPRYLGAEAIGQFHLANAVWAIMGMVVTFGMDALLVKEVSRAPEESSILLGTTLFLRIGLYIVSFAAVLVYVGLAGYPPVTVNVILIVGFATLIWQFGDICQAFLQGLERMEYISLANVAGKVFGTAVSITLLLLGHGILVIAFVTVGIALISFLVQFTTLNRIYPVRLRFDKSKAIWMLKESIPFLTSGIFLVLYLEIDIIVISLLVNEEVVGWYGASDQLFSALLFVPTVFITAVFPAMSRMYSRASNSLAHLVSKSFNILFLLGLPLGLGIFIIADQIVLLLFGDQFINSGPILAIKGIVLTLTYQNMLIGMSLNSIDKHKAWAIVIAITALATIPLDLLLIPWAQKLYGNAGIGGALVFVITEIGMLLAGFWLLPNDLLKHANYKMLARTLLAGAGMAATTWLVRDFFILIPIIVGAVTYISLIFLLKVIPEEDFELIKPFTESIAKKIRPRVKPLVPADR